MGETPSLDIDVVDGEASCQLDGVRSVARLSDERIRGWFRRPAAAPARAEPDVAVPAGLAAGD